MALQSLGVLPPAADDSGLQSVGVLDQPDWLEVMRAAPQLAGLHIYAGVGGALRGIGDLTGADTLEELGATLYRDAQNAALETTPVGMSEPQRHVLGALTSVAEQAPMLLGGLATMVPRGVLWAAGLQGATTYGELREDGFSGGRAAVHAAIDGAAEGLGEYMYLPVLSKVGMPIAKQVTELFTRELFGEEVTTALQSLNAKLSNQPNMTLAEYLQAAKDTAIQTPLAVGIQTGTVRSVQKVADILQRRAEERAKDAFTVPPTSAPTGTPTAEPQTPAEPSRQEPAGKPAEPAEPAIKELTPKDADLKNLKDLYLQVPVYVEETGETEEVRMPAEQAYKESKLDTIRYRKLLKCLAS